LRNKGLSHNLDLEGLAETVSPHAIENKETQELPSTQILKFNRVICKHMISLNLQATSAKHDKHDDQANKIA
jgi:hypothetical protein